MFKQCNINFPICLFHLILPTVIIGSYRTIGWLLKEPILINYWSFAGFKITGRLLLSIDRGICLCARALKYWKVSSKTKNRIHIVKRYKRLSFNHIGNGRIVLSNSERTCSRIFSLSLICLIGKSFFESILKSVSFLEISLLYSKRVDNGLVKSVVDCFFFSIQMSHHYICFRAQIIRYEIAKIPDSDTGEIAKIDFFGNLTARRFRILRANTN